jgi:hypothetical protein
MPLDLLHRRRKRLEKDPAPPRKAQLSKEKELLRDSR